MPRTLRSVVLFLLAVGCGAPAAHARLALDLSPGGFAAPCGTDCGTSATAGWNFTVDGAITVEALGVWDSSRTPPFTSEVGLWSAGGTLLASATITQSGAPAASTNPTGQWRLESVSPLTLAPGDYVIGNTFFPATPLAQAFAPFTTIPEIHWGQGRVGTPGGGFELPQNADPVVLFGATFAVVPEPATMGLVGLGLAGLFAQRARRQA